MDLWDKVWRGIIIYWLLILKVALNVNRKGLLVKFVIHKEKFIISIQKILGYAKKLKIFTIKNVLKVKGTPSVNKIYDYDVLKNDFN